MPTEEDVLIEKARVLQRDAPALNFCRLFGAIHITTLFHYITSSSSSFSGWGSTWVCFFFMVSGFGPAHSRLMRAPVAWKNDVGPLRPQGRTLARRLLNVYAPYALALTLILLIRYAAFPKENHGVEPLLERLLPVLRHASNHSANALLIGREVAEGAKPEQNALPLVSEMSPSLPPANIQRLPEPSSNPGCNGVLITLEYLMLHAWLPTLARCAIAHAFRTYPFADDGACSALEHDIRDNTKSAHDTLLIYNEPDWYVSVLAFYWLLENAFFELGAVAARRGGAGFSMALGMILLWMFIWPYAGFPDIWEHFVPEVMFGWRIEVLSNLQ